MIKKYSLLVVLVIIFQNVNANPFGNRMIKAPELSGVIICDGKKYALLKFGNSCHHLTIGDSYDGWKVLEISDSKAVKIKSATNKTVTLAN